MKKVNLVVLSARGRDSFTEAQQKALEGSAHVRFLRAPDRLFPGRFVKSLQGADVAGLTPRGTPPLSVSLLARLPRLRTVVIPTSGTEWINREALRACGVRLSHVPDFCSDSAAEFTWGLVVALVRHLVPAHESLQKRRGMRVVSWRGLELRGKTLGIVGMGAIGRRVARFARTFGMKPIACDPRPFPKGLAQRASFHAVLGECDILSLHAPLIPETTHLLDADSFRRMKPGAYLVNTARPGLVDSKAALSALNERMLAGYAYDRGYTQDDSDALLRRHPRVLAVPHISWYTREAAAREMDRWVGALLAAARGRPERLVE